MNKEELTQLFNSQEVLYKQEGVLRFDAFINIEGLSLEEFLSNLVVDYARLYNTLDTDDNIQCDYNRNRSLGDIYRITLSYFPEVSLVEVIQALITLVNQEDEVMSMRCGDISKRVYYNRYKGYGRGVPFNNGGSMSDPRDEFDLKAYEYMPLLDLTTVETN